MQHGNDREIERRPGQIDIGLGRGTGGKLAHIVEVAPQQPATRTYTIRGRRRRRLMQKHRAQLLFDDVANARKDLPAHRI
ncbi:MAG: hypothetical protein WDN04_09210 [Rhodospirillales bacterium]